jgi:hypothetical protein
MCRHIREQQPNWDIKTCASSLAARSTQGGKEEKAGV